MNINVPVFVGTHWGFEIISMLLKGNAETVPIPKEFAMLEFTTPADLEKLPSPRVLNSHFPLCILPRQLKGIVGKDHLCKNCIIP